jgi:hypothetical protein
MFKGVCKFIWAWRDIRAFRAFETFFKENTKNE